MIPIGTFKATISHLGTTTTVIGDASTQAVTTEKIFASYPTFGLIVGVAITATAAALMLVRRHNIRRRKEMVTLNPELRGSLSLLFTFLLLKGYWK
jgi:hypothetical protein